MAGRPSNQLGYTVTYDSSNHLATIFQRWGSVWPKVFPYCCLNVFIMILVAWIDSLEDISLGISDNGHKFLSILVAFLVVSRVTISLGRYNAAREHLENLYMATRDVVQSVVLHTRDRSDAETKDWRNNVAWRVVVLLRSAMAVIDYGTDGIPAWELPELDPVERAALKSNLYLERSDSKVMQWAHEEQRTEMEESMRVPIMLAFELRCAILDNTKALGNDGLDVFLERGLLEKVDQFMRGYYGILKGMTTPFPFPLVQMAQTVLFFYIFTLPFAFVDDMSNQFALICSVFVITYGFIGLEKVAIQLDNPFGDDANDFDNLRMAYTAIEDVYLMIYRANGPEYVEKLRSRMEPANTDTSLSNERTALLRASVYNRV